MLFQEQISKLALSDFSAAVMKTPNELPARKIEPPELFIDEVYTSKPIATQKKISHQQVFKCSAIVIAELLEQSIIEPSVSPRRTQAFAVQSQKARMVIHYSQTVSKYITVDAYSFPDMSGTLDELANHQHFCKLVLSSAFDQNYLNARDVSGWQIV